MYRYYKKDKYHVMEYDFSSVTAPVLSAATVLFLLEGISNLIIPIKPSLVLPIFKIITPLYNLIILKYFTYILEICLFLF